MLESIKKIVEKPIEIRNETHVSYTAPQPAPAPFVNDYEHFPQASTGKRYSYLDEYD